MAETSVERRPGGEAAELADHDLLAMYRLMVLTRCFEERSREWYTKGISLEVPHSSIGQEAIGVGTCYGLLPGDWVLPSLRTRAAFFARDVSLRDMVATMCAKANGWSGGRETSHHAGIPERGVLVGSGVVGESIAVAAGAALALKMQRQGGVIIDFFGDGAANRGDFHEALNLSGVLRLPVIWVCENNGWAMSVPQERSSAAADIALRAQGYGIPGVVVDGNDVLAVHEAAREAVKRARSGNGPTLLECKTWRWRSHCEVPALKVEPWRSDEETERWRQRCPIARLRATLERRGLWTPAQNAALVEETEASLDDALAYALASPDPVPSDAPRHVYAESTQREGLRR